MPIKVGVKFCGGCNPYIDRKKLINNVQRLLPDKFTFEYFDFRVCKLFLIINGCGVACAEYPKSQRTVIVSGLHIEGKKFAEQDLPSEVVERILAMCQKRR